MVQEFAANTNFAYQLTPTSLQHKQSPVDQVVPINAPPVGATPEFNLLTVPPVTIKYFNCKVGDNFI